MDPVFLSSIRGATFNCAILAQSSVHRAPPSDSPVPLGAAEWKQTLTADNVREQTARFHPLSTLLRIWPDVDTFRMSFCGVPGSCSGSLSDDSSRHRAAADSGPPASAILPSDPRGGRGEGAPPGGEDRTTQRSTWERRLLSSGGQTVVLQQPDVVSASLISAIRNSDFCEILMIQIVL